MLPHTAALHRAASPLPAHTTGTQRLWEDVTPPPPPPPPAPPAVAATWGIRTRAAAAAAAAARQSPPADAGASASGAGSSRPSAAAAAPAPAPPAAAAAGASPHVPAPHVIPPGFLSGLEVVPSARMLMWRESGSAGPSAGFSDAQRRHMHCYRNLPR